MAIDQLKEVEQIYAKKDYVKENKFKAEIQKEVRQAKSSVLDKGVHISFRTMFFAVVLLLLVSSSFLTGRYVFPSTGQPGIFAAVSAYWTTEDTEEKVAPVEELVEQLEVTATEEVETTEETAVAEAEEAETEEAAVPDPASQAVITSYNNVNLDFTRTPVYEWKGDDAGWGKITDIYYTITNSEKGIVKPAYFKIILEGYESNDEIKKVDVPQNTLEISAGETVQNAVSKLIAYNQAETDPANIGITLQLYDASDTLIATANQEFNLK